MIAHGQGHGIWAAYVCFAALALAGCGANGASSVYIPPANPAPSVSGTVYAPNGQFAAAEHWWAEALRLMPPAYAALQSELPITTEENVSLSKLDPAEAAHGSTDQALLLANGSTDPADGSYFISNDQLTGRCVVQAGNGERCIVQVGSGDMLTRAFVFSCKTASGVSYSCTTAPGVSWTADIDAVSEAVVRLVLDYLMRTSTQLGDFSNADLENIDCIARALANDISGTNVADINEKVYNRLAASQTMQNCLQQPDQYQCH